MARMFRDIMSEEEYRKRLLMARVRVKFKRSMIKSLETSSGGYLKQYCEQTKRGSGGVIFYKRGEE